MTAAPPAARGVARAAPPVAPGSRSDV